MKCLWVKAQKTELKIGFFDLVCFTKKNRRIATITLLFFTILLQIFSTNASAVEFTGTFRSFLHVTVCGGVGSNIGLFGKDGNIQAYILNQVSTSAIDVTPYIDDEKYYSVSGYLYEGTGQCNQGVYEYLHVESVEESPPTNSFCTNVTEIPTSQCDALADLFNSTNGEEWKDKTNWLETEKPSDWHGVTVQDGNVIHLNLNDNNLQGELPETIGNLSHLDYLNLSDNQLSGKIPDSVGALSELIQLWIGGNQLTLIPDTVGDLSKLTHLDLHLNQISNLPPQIGELTSLTYLNLHSNQITSESIPDEMGKLLALESVSLHNNQLSGDVLKVISKWQNLWGLDLSWNPLEELLPEIGHLTKLRTLKLHNCKLEQLPNEIGELTQLADLNLMINLLTTDSFPAEFGDLVSLEILSLHNNSLERLPEPVSRLKNLKGIDLSWNKSLQSLEGIGEMESLEILKLHSTDQVDLPQELSNLIQLKELFLNGNLFTQFPMVVTELTSLEKLSLTYNPQLTGELPSDLTKLTQIKEFTFDGTDLCIPQNDELQAWLNNIPTVQSSEQVCNCQSDLGIVILILQILTGHNVSDDCADLDTNGKVELKDALIALAQLSEAGVQGDQPSLSLMVATDTDSLKLAWMPGNNSNTAGSDIQYDIHLSEQDEFTPSPASLKKTVINTTQAAVTGLETDKLYYGKIVTTTATRKFLLRFFGVTQRIYCLQGGGRTSKLLYYLQR